MLAEMKERGRVRDWVLLMRDRAPSDATLELLGNCVFNPGCVYWRTAGDSSFQFFNIRAYSLRRGGDLFDIAATYPERKRVFLSSDEASRYSLSPAHMFYRRAVKRLYWARKRVERKLGKQLIETGELRASQRVEEVPQIDIAMPAYNCAPWLDGFMASLLAQDFTDWRLIARDDGSKDNTNWQLAQWHERLQERMIVLPDSGRRNLGLIANYTAVLTAATAPWIMSADPDDIWLPGKITRSVRAMREAETASGAGTPIAICTDAAVVDSNRQPVAPSFWRWSRIDPRFMPILARAAMESVALGSTMMLNRALLDRALPMETQVA